MHQARGLDTSESGFRIFQSACAEMEISPRSRMDLKIVVAYNSDTISWMSEDFQ